MITKVFKVDDLESGYWAIEEAAELIRRGELVAFPTETVYGLGANALDSAAVRRIFAAKGRPGDNPLIVHIGKQDELVSLVREVPQKAYSLMDAFWPGPLTLIMDKSPVIPDEVTGGLKTVAIRMPSHWVARAFINESMRPIAAPSANLSGCPSPTTAQHVLTDLEGRIPLILDGGRADVGLESTVLDMTSDIPVVLRPGGVTKEMLEEVLGEVRVDRAVLNPVESCQEIKSPGMKYGHYSPKAPLIIIKGELGRMAERINKMAKVYAGEGKKVGILATQETQDFYIYGQVLTVGSRANPSTIAANLFAVLRAFDHLEVDIILSEWIDERDEGLAIMNRMLRAACFNVIEI